VEAGATLNGPVLLDATANGRPLRREGMPHTNRSQHPLRVPRGIFEARGDDCWVAIDCRDDRDWNALATAIGEDWASTSRYASLDGRAADEDGLEKYLTAWTLQRDPFETERLLQAAGVPAAAVRRPEERIDKDPDTAAFDLWPEVEHSEMGRVRVEGVPAHLSETDWRIERGAPCLGEHNEFVYGEILGLSSGEIDSLRAEGVV
jgi:crotonobetainyl-CoA:carnitine CoA-transferase CaiB-like acyl-CoA transferase